MRYQARPLFLFVAIAALLCAGVALSTKTEASGAGVGPSALASPSPTPRSREELPQDSDEVVKFDTNLTNIFFTAADKNKRFISDLKAETIRVLEDGEPQEIFTFQTNIDLPLSLAILIDTSAPEERTLPDEKAAARAFMENLLRAKDEAAIVSFTGETTLEQGFTGNVERLRHAIDRVAQTFDVSREALLERRLAGKRNDRRFVFRAQQIFHERARGCLFVGKRSLFGGARVDQNRE